MNFIRYQDAEQRFQEYVGSENISATYRFDAILLGLKIFIRKSWTRLYQSIDQNSNNLVR